MEPLSPRAIAFLRRYHAGGVTEQNCLACSSPCCSHGGFAVLENVLQIYEQYQSGALRRRDFEFPAGLSFRDFVFRYFDVYRRSVEREGHEVVVMLFHMRSVSSDGHLIEIPPVGDYWETRNALFGKNPWLSRGCVFLSHNVGNWPDDDGDASRHCILHSSSSGSHVTAKPIDCVFYTCDRPILARVPTTEQSSEWFGILADSFPGSLERFEELIGVEPKERSESDDARTTDEAAGANRFRRLWSRLRRDSS